MSRLALVATLGLLATAPGCAELASGLNDPPTTMPAAVPESRDTPSEARPAATPVEPPAAGGSVADVSPRAIPPSAPVIAPKALDPEVLRASSRPTAEPTRPEAPQGRVIAKVGDEVVTLPELTRAVKSRLAATGGDDPDRRPTRKQIVGLARSTLEAKIVGSLVRQEARARLGDLAETEEALAARWTAEELPRLLRREGGATEADLRAILGKRGRSLDEEREAYLVRALAAELKARETGGAVARMSDREFSSYLDGLRRRIPVESVLTAKQVAAAAGDPEAKGDATRAPAP